MTEYITVRGFVATDPEPKNLPDGTALCTFRFASTARWFDTEKREWKSGHTNWMTVTVFRHLSQNLISSVKAGTPLIVQGKLRVKDWPGEDGSWRTKVELEATSVGIDLSFGTANFARTIGGSRSSTAGRDPEQGDRGIGGWHRSENTANTVGEQQEKQEPRGSSSGGSSADSSDGLRSALTFPDESFPDPMTDERESLEAEAAMH